MKVIEINSSVNSGSTGRIAEEIGHEEQIVYVVDQIKSFYSKKNYN